MNSSEYITLLEEKLMPFIENNNEEELIFQQDNASVHIILVIILYLNYTSAECNVCQVNHAACINSTSFYLCFEDTGPSLDTLYHCDDGFDCTDLNAICVQSSSNRPPSCGDTSLCGMCSAHRNNLFACLSRTTFQMCYGANRPIGKIGYCPTGLVCHSSSDAVCVLEDSVDSVTCDVVNDNTSSSSTPNPTVTSSSVMPDETTTENPSNKFLTPTQVCEQVREAGLHPVIPNDPYCKRYIYCFFKNGIIQGMEYNCSSGTYYHIQQEQCVLNKPNYCL